MIFQASAFFAPFFATNFLAAALIRSLLGRLEARDFLAAESFFASTFKLTEDRFAGTTWTVAGIRASNLAHPRKGLEFAIAFESQLAPPDESP